MPRNAVAPAFRGVLVNNFRNLAIMSSDAPAGERSRVQLASLTYLTCPDFLVLTVLSVTLCVQMLLVTCSG